MPASVAERVTQVPPSLALQSRRLGLCRVSKREIQLKIGDTISGPLSAPMFFRTYGMSKHELWAAVKTHDTELFVRWTPPPLAKH